jgi:hypothetical protein
MLLTLKQKAEAVAAVKAENPEPQLLEKAPNA